MISLLLHESKAKPRMSVNKDIIQMCLAGMGPNTSDLYLSTHFRVLVLYLSIF